MAEVDDGTTLGGSDVVLVGLLDVGSEVDVLVSVGVVLVSSWASAAGVAAKAASAPAKTTPATRLNALPTVTPNGGDLRCRDYRGFTRPCYLAKAAPRSRQRSSGSSRPTLNRISPGGTRSSPASHARRST